LLKKKQFANYSMLKDNLQLFDEGISEKKFCFTQSPRGSTYILRSIRQHGDDTRASTKHERSKMCWIVEVLLSPPAANVIRRSKTINPRSRIRSLVKSNFLAGRRSFSREEKSPWSISSSVRIAIILDSKESYDYWSRIPNDYFGLQVSRGKKKAMSTNALSGIRNYVTFIDDTFVILLKIVSVSIKCYISTYLFSINNQFIISMHVYR